MSAIRIGMLLGLSGIISGCGLAVPEIQENRLSPNDGTLMVQAIIQSVHCEVIRALKDVRQGDVDDAKKFHQARQTDFLLKWGAQLTLTLTMDEKSTLSPTAVWTPHTAPSALFTLSGGASASADATRTDKMTFYYTIPSLLDRDYCATGIPRGHENSLLVQSDLKLEEWLFDYVGALGTHEAQAPTDISGALKSTVLSHDVKFDVVSTGNITPAWKLINSNYNQSGTLFSTSRDRTHDLIVTLGPGDKTGFTILAPQIADQSQQISNAITTGLKGLTAP